MRIDAFDPEENEPDAIDLQADLDRYFLAYYEPFLVVIEQAAEVHRNDVTTEANLEPLGMRIGLLTVIESALRETSERQPEGLAARIKEALSRANSPGHVEEDGSTLFLDGTFIYTDWNSALTASDAVV